MAPATVWCLLIDLNNDPDGALFKVLVENTEDDIADFKAKVKEAANLKDVNTRHLIVWRCKDRSTVLGSSNLKNNVRKIFNEGGAERINEMVTMAELAVAPKEPLLVQVAIDCDHMGKNDEKYDIPEQQRPAYEEYRDCFFRTPGGDFGDEVLKTNMVCVIGPHGRHKAPDHLKLYQKELQKQREIHPRFKDTLIFAFDNDNVFDELYDLDSIDENVQCALEMTHMVSLAPEAGDQLLAKGWKELEAHAVFFVHFARYCMKFLLHLSPSCGLGRTQWPFGLVFHVEAGVVQHQPRSDFCLSLRGIPRVIAEVKSRSNSNERNRMLAQGASLVRLANKILVDNDGQPNFILMAIYLDDDAKIDRYLLYQSSGNSEEDDKNVYCLREPFSNNQGDRARLVHQMYNLTSWSDDVEKLTRVKDVGTHLNKCPQLGEFHFRVSKGSKKKTRGGQGECLEVDGYTHLTTLSLSNKMPYIFIVRRLKDGKQFIAKVNRNTHEKDILEYLRTRDPPSEQVIPLVGSLSSNIGPTILLPVRRSIQALVQKPEGHRGRFLQFAEDLIEGLAFLHRHGVAHRDVKPDNLVYCDTFRLQIIDFDQVGGANDLMDDDVGTEEWKAPETIPSYGRLMPYSPIKADRWACGSVILVFLCCSGRRHERLEGFANRLTDEEPELRPPLREWCNWKDHMVTTVTTGKRPRVEESDKSGLHKHMKEA